MNQEERFKIEYFDLLLVDFTKKVLERAHGNYTKHYELFKRIENTEVFFRKEISRWIRISINSGFTVPDERRGALIFGGYPYDRRPVLFSFIMLIDQIFDRLPFFKNWGEAITLKLIKLQNV